MLIKASNKKAKARSFPLIFYLTSCCSHWFSESVFNRIDSALASFPWQRFVLFSVFKCKRQNDATYTLVNILTAKFSDLVSGFHGDGDRKDTFRSSGFWFLPPWMLRWDQFLGLLLCSQRVSSAQVPLRDSATCGGSEGEPGRKRKNTGPENTDPPVGSAPAAAEQVSRRSRWL